MTNLEVATDDDHEEQTMRSPLRAIAAGEARRRYASSAESPLLATQTVKVGATREEARTYYFERIAHYALRWRYGASHRCCRVPVRGRA